MGRIFFAQVYHMGVLKINLVGYDLSDILDIFIAFDDINLIGFVFGDQKDLIVGIENLSQGGLFSVIRIKSDDIPFF